MSIATPTGAAEDLTTDWSVRPHLEFLDGLRGLAALYVVVHHAYMELAYRGDSGGLSFVPRHLTNWISFGQVAVDIFIVLSGYCLMLPVARTTDGDLRGGARQFFLRRARRILPPYYAALTLTLLLIGLVPAVKHLASVRWPGPGPEFTPHVLISHLLLVHNLSRYWAWAIDYPMWSVATEWQIYFLFPTLLLPVWQRFGSVSVVAVALSLGLMLHHFIPRFDQACPWFLGLFAFGMAGAVLNFSSRPGHIRVRRTTRWLPLAIGFFLLFWLATEFWPKWLWNFNWVLDVFIGFSTSCLLVYCTRFLTEHPQITPPPILRLLQSRVAVEIGVFFYSLYLIHAPLVALVHWALQPLHLSPGPYMLAQVICGPLVALTVAYPFHRAFERPFMSGSPQTEKQAIQAATAFPAP